MLSAFRTPEQKTLEVSFWYRVVVRTTGKNGKQWGGFQGIVGLSGIVQKVSAAENTILGAGRFFDLLVQQVLMHLFLKQGTLPEKGPVHELLYSIPQHQGTFAKGLHSGQWGSKHNGHWADDAAKLSSSPQVIFGLVLFSVLCLGSSPFPAWRAQWILYKCYQQSLMNWYSNWVYL